MWKTYAKLFPKQGPSEGESISIGSTHATGLNGQTKNTEEEIHRC